MFLKHQLEELFLCRPLQGLHIQRWLPKRDYLAIPACSSGKQLYRSDARGAHNNAVLHLNAVILPGGRGAGDNPFGATQ